MNRSLLVSAFALALASAAAGGVSVRRVVDGDTLVLSNGKKVRLIGIDTPEVHKSAKLQKDAARTHHDERTIRALGARSAAFVRSLMTGRAVRLDYDPANRSRKNRDRYGRTLVYVYFDPPACEDLEQSLAEQVCDLRSYETGFLNALIIEAGYANIYAKAPFKFRDDFHLLERQAREKKRGLWKDGLQFTLTDKLRQLLGQLFSDDLVPDRA